MNLRPLFCFMLAAALTVMSLAACVAPGIPAEPGIQAPPSSTAQEEAAASQEEGQLEEVSAEQDLEELRIEVEYFTPSQTEGPFYPVQMPEDRDSDLFVVEGAEGSPAGEILVFGGTLYDGAGMPVPGAVIEIWQTDDNGIYMHPGDSDSSKRDVNFQSYGRSETGPDGRYGFRTIMPGAYNPRPRHIHVKVWKEGHELLTTQFYFSNDPNASSDRIFAGTGEEVSALIMEVGEGLDSEGNSVLIGRRDIVLRDVFSE
ncbi:MAG: protocatechuate 3,4-dioxygenase [Caldilineaceae bacterium]|nr:protocatechuate 3,4-dioxygenase [Caldilineaceae bacterium]